MKKFSSMLVMILCCTCVSAFADEVIEQQTVTSAEVSVSESTEASVGDIVSQNSDETDIVNN